MKEYFKYVNTVLLVVILAVLFSGGGKNKLSAVLNTASTFYDVNVDSTNGVGTATYAVNGTPVISSSTGINVNASVLTATTSITSVAEITTAGIRNSSGTTIGSGTTIKEYNCGSKLYTIPALSPVFSQSGAQYASTTVSVANAALGDIANVSNNSTTAAINVYGVIANAAITTSDGTSTVMFHNVTQATSTAVTTSTIEVCAFDQ